MRDNVVFCISLFIIGILVFNCPEGFFIIPPFVLFLLILITLTFIQYNVFSWITSLFKKGSCVTFKTVLEIHQMSDVNCSYWENFYESKKLKKDNPNSYYHYEYQKAIDRLFTWCIVIVLSVGSITIVGTRLEHFLQYLGRCFVMAIIFFSIITLIKNSVNIFNLIKEVIKSIQKTLVHYFSGK